MQGRCPQGSQGEHHTRGLKHTTRLQPKSSVSLCQSSEKVVEKSVLLESTWKKMSRKQKRPITAKFQDSICCITLFGAFKPELWLGYD